jgi:hypothetical protein
MHNPPIFMMYLWIALSVFMEVVHSENRWKLELPVLLRKPFAGVQASAIFFVQLFIRKCKVIAQANLRLSCSIIPLLTRSTSNPTIASFKKATHI